MRILQTPDTVTLTQFEVYEALAIAVKQKTSRDIAHIVNVSIYDVCELGSEEHKDITVTATLKDST